MALILSIVSIIVLYFLLKRKNKKAVNIDKDIEDKNKSLVGKKIDQISSGDEIAQIEGNIAEYNKQIESSRKRMAENQKDLEQAEIDLKAGVGSQDAILRIEKDIEDDKEDIAELKKKEIAAKKKLADLH
ncbi:MAG: hypothetical protein CL832_08635 [Crocinitomicaceae bacterium]|nr:hypothetical protein [Crocinitomicaceae bacterium]MAW84444.1 hypothetical protein [Crocinitomicaceae bacterium]|tara:strand:- start:1443 stop:1832 length:390 start_codon:yes stop_codon:yes gene_type:complete